MNSGGGSTNKGKNFCCIFFAIHIFYEFNFCIQSLHCQDTKRQQTGEGLTKLEQQKEPTAKEATKQFADRVRRFYNSENLRERVSDDVEKSKFTQQEWYTASISTSTILDKKLKESKTLLFFVGLDQHSTYTS